MAVQRYGRYVPVSQRRPGQGTGVRGVRGEIGITTNAEQYREVVEQFAEEAREKQAKMIIRVALEMYAELIESTPRDTGFASSGWNFSLDKIDSGEPPAPLPDAVQRVGAFVKGVEAEKRIKAGQDVTIYISNHVDYIVFIMEDGTSKQAPPGTFTTIVTKWQTYAQQANVSLLTSLGKGAP